MPHCGAIKVFALLLVQERLDCNWTEHADWARTLMQAWPAAFQQAEVHGIRKVGVHLHISKITHDPHSARRNSMNNAMKNKARHESTGY